MTNGPAGYRYMERDIHGSVFKERKEGPVDQLKSESNRRSCHAPRRDAAKRPD